MKTGELIKKLRKDRGFTAESLAEKIGVHPATMYRYENGDIAKIPAGTLFAIAEALDVSPLELLGDN